MAQTPIAGANSQITVGAQAVVAAPAGGSGGYIVNPLMPSDQGLITSEVLYVDVVGTCTNLAANGTTVALQPGQSFDLVPGATTATYVNAVSSGHKFTVVQLVKS